MNVKRFLLLIIVLFVTSTGVRAAKNAQGYWVMDHIEFSGNPWTDYSDGDWSVSQNSASSSVVSFSWQDPPSKIALGEEGKIKIHFSEQIWETDNGGYGFWGSIWLPRFDRGLNLWGNDDGVMSSYTDQSDFERLDIKSGDVLTINLWPFYQDNDLNRLSKTITYVYTFVGEVKEVVTPVTPEPGEQEGPEIPWTFIVVGGVVAGGAAIAIKKGGKNKTNKKKETKKQKPQEEEEPPHSTYRMILYKNFGDTLVANDPPQTISARIEEITYEGRKIERDDLTAKIQITAEMDCKVSNVRMEGKYKSADVVATKEPEGEEIGEARVRMVFIGPGGALINHVVFKVKGAPKIVVDEAITFEAESGATQHVDFGINNFEGTVLGVEVTIDGGGNEFFTSKIEQPDPKIPLWFRINLTERGKPQEDPSAQEKKHVAGDAGRFTCNIKVNLQGREEPIRGSFAIYRFYLGVNLDINALKGYLVTYDSTYKEETLATEPKGRKKWGESYVAFKLYAREKDTNEIKVLLPDSEPIFTFEDVWEGSVRFADKNGTIVESLCRLMNFKYEFKDVSNDGTVVGILRSSGGGLLPPNRGKAKVTIRVTYNGVTYDDFDTVTICSQPYRNINDNREYSRVLHEDEEKMRQLIDMRQKILFDRRFAELTPFYYKLNMMIEAYSDAYGFYEPDYQKMMRVFKRYCSGEIGTYFVNDSVWKPDWTEADENFNAFVATFAKMERNLWLLPARIALAYFTAGASELVLAPYSGLVRMHEYANSGKGDTFSGFVIASAEVVFWEGVFHVAGKAVKWTGGKIADYAVKKGYDKQLKSAYDKIKKSVEEYMKSKSTSNGLKNTKNYSTKQLADKVKDAGEKTVKSKSAATAKANDAIRKTIEQGDDVVRFGSPEFNEECARWAKQDAEKILENFKKVMNDPTATPEQMRRATLALQGNKAAQNLLRESSSDLLRANFNHNIQKIYKEVDPLTIKKLAKRLGIPEKDIQVWSGASSNAGGDLYLGKKIGADRDVTFQMRGKDGKWVDIDECIQEEAYAEAFNEYHYGFMPEDMQEAVKTLRKFDQAVVNGEKGLESFGQDLKNIINPDFQTSKLIDPERVAKTVKYKCEFWMNQGRSCRDQAEQLFKAGMVDEAKHVMGYGEELVKEGVRMNVKEFKRILAPRIQALKVRGVSSQKYELLYEKIKVLESVGTPPPKDVMPQSLQQARSTLANQYGTTIEEVVTECTNVIQEVNESL
ncbi:MAG: hypothetical protein K5920_03225 [Bacteroidales bacterium]|nr:hypothetical protein [Bacteroidales bacterium]